MLVLLDHLGEPAIAAPLMVRFELRLLRELGFGLDLASCAVTGATQELVHVSPKSGRAVSRAAGEPYADRLLPLPAFVRDGFLGAEVTGAEIAQGFRLTGHFLMRDVYEPRGLALPDERAVFVEAASR
jgi:DNA repair protein RecO (recombination protein O)